MNRNLNSGLSIQFQQNISTHVWGFHLCALSRDCWLVPGDAAQVRRWGAGLGVHHPGVILTTLKLGTKTHKLWQAQSPQLPSLFYLFHELSLQCLSGASSKLVCTWTSFWLDICKVINITIILYFMHHYSCQRWGSINQPFFFNPLWLHFIAFIKTKKCHISFMTKSGHRHRAHQSTIWSSDLKNRL